MEKNDLIYWAKRTYEIGASPSTSGNISIRSGDNSLYITSSGSAAADLSEEEIIKIDFEGKVLEGNKKPSSEKFMHIEIYKKRPDISAIIHSHSPEITAFAVSGLEINKVIMPEFAFYFGSVPLAKYYIPGSNELAIEVASCLKDKNAVLMENHGVVVLGKNLKEAFYSLESIRAYCRTYLYSKLLGKINVLDKKEIQKIEQLKKG